MNEPLHSAMTVQLAKMDLKAGDTLAVMVPFRLAAEQREKVQAMVHGLLPEGVKAAVFDCGVTLAKISGEAPNA